jgi:hypothetical protein
MSDLIDAMTAKKLLGCDDATLSNHINSGNLRAQRVDGQLMIVRADVDVLAAKKGAKEESSDSILVLDGESEDLSIDLGEVVDDGAQTMAMGSATRPPSNTEQITFGEELEVVSFDDGRKSQVSSDTEATIQFDPGATENLNFTDANTAVVTDVDETITATSDYQTVDDGDMGPNDGAGAGAASLRRSGARSQRVRPVQQKIHPMWVVLGGLNLIISAAVIAPYYMMMVWPKNDAQPHYNGQRVTGLVDSQWTGMAETFVGFSVDPVKERWERSNPGGTWTADPAAPVVWRHKEYLGAITDPAARARVFDVTKVEVATEGEGAEAVQVPKRAIRMKDDGTSELKSFDVQMEEIKTPSGEVRKVPKPILNYR